MTIQRPPQNLCTAIKSDGTPCNAIRMNSSPKGLCWFHSTWTAKEELPKSPIEEDIITQIETGIFSPLFTPEEQGYYSTWKVVDKALFGIEITDNEFEVYKKITGRTERPTGPYYEFYGVCGRRGLKTFSIAILGTRQSCQDWSKYIKPGESAEALIVANDKAQASVLLGYVKRILALPGLKHMVEKVKQEEILLKNGITIRVAYGSYRTIRGRTCVFFAMDELAFSRESGAVPIEELVVAVRPAMLTVPTAMMVGISTPYTRSGHLWEVYNKHYGKNDSRTLVIQASSLTMNPSLNKEVIEAEMSKDTRALSEYGSSFREDLESFLPGDVVEACVPEGRTSIPYVSGNVYQCYIDPSSGRGKDRFAMAISHYGWKQKKVVLDLAIQRKPHFKPGVVVSEFAKIMKQYRVFKIYTDRYGTGFIQELFEKEGIHVEVSPWTSSQVFLEMQPLMITGGVELLDVPELKDQFKNLELTRRANGNHFVSHPQWSDSFHDDLSVAISGSCVATSLKPTYTANSPEMLAMLPVTSTDQKDSISKIPVWERDAMVERGELHVLEDDRGRKKYMRASIQTGTINMKQKENKHA